MIITINMTLFDHDCTYVMIVCITVYSFKRDNMFQSIIRLVLYTNDYTIQWSISL